MKNSFKQYASEIIEQNLARILDQNEELYWRVTHNNRGKHLLKIAQKRDNNLKLNVEDGQMVNI